MTSGLRAEPLHERRLEPGVGQNAARLVLELGKRLHAVGRDQRLVRGEAVDALLRVDDEDTTRLVDAVHGADVDAGSVFDVDTGLGDDVRHGGKLYPAGYSADAMQPLDHFPRALEERRFGDHLVESGCVRAAQPGGVRVIRVAEDRDVRVVVRDVVRVDPSDVGDHEVGRIDPFRRREPVLGKHRLQLAADEEVDPTQQDRRHSCGRP